MTKIYIYDILKLTHINTTDNVLIVDLNTSIRKWFTSHNLYYGMEKSIIKTRHSVIYRFDFKGNYLTFYIKEKAK